MAVRLDKEIKREVLLDNRPYTVTLSPTAVQIAPKGQRKAKSVTWKDLASGDFELDNSLARSVAAAGIHGRSGKT